MGLDMYLHRKTYVKNWEFTKPENVVTVSVTRGGEPFPGIDPDKIKFIVEEVAYWRKANQIHRWFVEAVQDGVDDCKEYYVSTQQLRELVRLCKEALANKGKAPEILPTRGGFFFGNIDYDEYYEEDLKSTIEQLTPLLNDEMQDYYYHSSW